MKISIEEFCNLLDTTLAKTINDGLQRDEEMIELTGLTEEDLIEMENNYRLIGELFGRNYMSNLLDIISKLEEEK